MRRAVPTLNLLQCLSLSSLPPVHPDLRSSYFGHVAANGGGMANGTPNFFAQLMNGGGGGNINHSSNGGSVGSQGSRSSHDMDVQDMEPAAAAYRYNELGALTQSQLHPARAGSELDLPKGYAPNVKKVILIGCVISRRTRNLSKRIS